MLERCQVSCGGLKLAPPAKISGRRGHPHGTDIRHETVRLWWNAFGLMFAGEIRQKRVQDMRSFIQWRWHLNGVLVKINGQKHYLRQTLDPEGKIPESCVTRMREGALTPKFLKKIVRRTDHRKSSLRMT